MTDLTKLDYTSLRKGYEKKDFKPSQVIEAYAQRMQELHHLNAFITPTIDHAMAQAADADRRQMDGTMRPLEGFPLAIKDNFCTKGIRTTASSAIMGDFSPFYESTVTDRLGQAGCINLGKTNMDEFAMGSSNENSFYGYCLNPWGIKFGKDLAPGGSSGGSATAAAARLALAALGTDTGGSIRQPAAFCGLVGLKPTYGRCSRYGIISFASSLDQAGPMTRSVEDALHLLTHMSGHDPADSTSSPKDSFTMKGSLNDSIKGLKVGIPKEFKSDALNLEMREWWDKTADWLLDAGAIIQEVSLPHAEYGLPTYYIIAPAEAASNLARYDGIRFGARVNGSTIEELYENTRTQGFGEEVKRRIMIGNYVLSSGSYEDYYLRALKVRRLFREEFTAVMKEVDVILTPTTPTVPFELGEKLNNPMDMYLSDMYTVGCNLAGTPAISVPVGISKNGLPIGMQFLGGDFEEETLLRVAYHIEKHAGFVDCLLGEIA